MIVATFPTYTQVLPGFEQAISGLRNNLLPVMSVLMIASLIGVAKDGYRAILFHLILLTILVGLAANWQPWFQQASTAVSATFTGDQYDLGKQTERYLIRLQVKAEQKDTDEGYVEAFFRAIMAGALLLLGYITKGIVLLFLVLQKILLTFAYALSPIFVGFFALRSTRGIAVNYLMTTVGLISWPLGFRPERVWHLRPGAVLRQRRLLLGRREFADAQRGILCPAHHRGLAPGFDHHFSGHHFQGDGHRCPGRLRSPGRCRQHGGCRHGCCGHHGCDARRRRSRWGRGSSGRWQRAGGLVGRWIGRHQLGPAHSDRGDARGRSQSGRRCHERRQRTWRDERRCRIGRPWWECRRPLIWSFLG